jgi:hypothetical protein
MTHDPRGASAAHDADRVEAGFVDVRSIADHQRPRHVGVEETSR